MSDVATRSYLGAERSACFLFAFLATSLACFVAMAHEIIMVRGDEVGPNPFSAPVSPEIMEAELVRIESAEKWAKEFGQACGCQRYIVDAVAQLINIGTSKWGFYPTMEKVLRHWPRATPATWWIMLEVDNNSDGVLFNKLAACAQHFHPYVLNEEHCEKFALALLQLVRDEMLEYAAERYRQQQEAYDAYAAGAGPIMG